MFQVLPLAFKVWDSVKAGLQMTPTQCGQNTQSGSDSESLPARRWHGDSKATEEAGGGGCVPTAGVQTRGRQHPVSARQLAGL